LEIFNPKEDDAQEDLDFNITYNYHSGIWAKYT
jgi:hypothetical protein